jgi:hypothetical protein
MEQIDRITNALVEEETAEEGEAITRGRMSPDKSLGTASIVGIALGFVGIISMAGERDTQSEKDGCGAMGESAPALFAHQKLINLLLGNKFSCVALLGAF